MGGGGKGGLVGLFGRLWMGGLDGWVIGRLSSWLVGCLVCCLVTEQCRSVGWMVCRSASR